MRTTQLPDPNSANLDVPCEAGYWPSFINHAVSGPIYFREHWGPLSIKCTVAGKEYYETGVDRYTVRPDNYIILNTGQLYSCEIRPDVEVTESFTVFFQPELADEVLASLIEPDDDLLDEPWRKLPNPVTFFEGPHHHDAVVSPLVRRLRMGGVSGLATNCWYDEQFNLLLEAMLCKHRGITAISERLPFKKYSTRIEILKRLLRARDYIDEYYTRELTLRALSREACMAPHHFLRMFHQAFHVTPHQYLTEKRLALARRLLATTGMPVTEICLEVGFTSLGSFSSLFSRTVGASPLEYRKENGRIT
jgi:AraC family transcriptional regulator